ncbi:MAG: hypothetical protein M3024_00520 [Candidatus Dormibacteraeota bacterium]|nr:hypothetical protein [Candidatus Dormibacteraeota bacterium]
MSPGLPAPRVLLHGFGVRYDLPLSLSLYIFSAAAVVVLSFMLVAVFAAGRVGPSAVQYPRFQLERLRGLPDVVWVRTVGGIIGVLFLLAVLATGWFGLASPERNPAEYLVWIYFWAGMVVVTGAIGPLPGWLNPFRALDALLRRLMRRPDQSAAGGVNDRLARVGLWPAAALFVGFAGFELTSGYANHPAVVAWLTFGYTALTVAGMQVYGARSWLAHCEFLTVLFSIVGRIAPIQVEGERIHLRWWGSGLLDEWQAGWDRIAFVILMLSTLAFDGLISTPLWQAIAADLAPLSSQLGPAWGSFAVRAFGLIDLALIFLAVFVAFMRMVIYFGTVKVDALATTTLFALTLVPIAWVYNLAHNYSYLVIQGQGLIPLLADPLGRGWHLLPTASYQVSFTLAQASTVWYAQVVLIVVGHIVAVVLAHLRAGERFLTARNALLSQYPMLLLMVMYTMTSLWILAQPITAGG